MKNCLKCGTVAQDSDRLCRECGHGFSYVADAEAAEETIASVSERPNGVGSMVFGYVCLAISIMTGMIGMTTNQLPTAITMNNASWLFLWLFLFFWGVGYIVKAISFLPGKGEQ